MSPVAPVHLFQRDADHLVQRLRRVLARQGAQFGQHRLRAEIAQLDHSELDQARVIARRRAECRRVEWLGQLHILRARHFDHHARGVVGMQRRRLELARTPDLAPRFARRHQHRRAPFAQIRDPLYEVGAAFARDGFGVVQDQQQPSIGGNTREGGGGCLQRLVAIMPPQLDQDFFREGDFRQPQPDHAVIIARLHDCIGEAALAQSADADNEQDARL